MEVLIVKREGEELDEGIYEKEENRTKEKEKEEKEEDEMRRGDYLGLGTLGSYS